MSLPASYFDGMYGDSDDPWGFRTRWYEARKRQLTLACLQSERYGTAFEPGCSIGVLSAELAARADRMMVTDVSARALDQARRVVPGHVEVRTGRMPQDWPAGRFDLVVCRRWRTTSTRRRASCWLRGPVQEPTSWWPFTAPIPCPTTPSAGTGSTPFWPALLPGPVWR